MKANIGTINSKFIEELALLQIEKDFQLHWIKYLEFNEIQGITFSEEEIQSSWDNWMKLKETY